MRDRDAKLSDMIGLTMASVVSDGEQVTFTAESGEVFALFHEQDCCESVRVNEIVGELDYLVGAPLLMAEEVSSEGTPAPENAESFTWTFYKFGTMKGYVDLRWLGESNGYYSEGVSFVRRS